MNISEIALGLFIVGTFISLLFLTDDIKKLKSLVSELTERIDELEEK